MRTYHDADNSNCATLLCGIARFVLVLHVREACLSVVIKFRDFLRRYRIGFLEVSSTVLIPSCIYAAALQGEGDLKAGREDEGTKHDELQGRTGRGPGRGVQDLAEGRKISRQLENCILI